MRAWISNAYHKGSTIYLWVRNEDGSKTLLEVHGFKPYFYIKSRFGEARGLFGEKLAKVVVDDPSQVREQRERYGETWEADVPYTRRFLIDMGIKTFLKYNGIGTHVRTHYSNLSPADPFDYEPRLWYLDIEVYSKGFPDPELAQDPVVSISIYDSYIDGYVVFAWHRDFVENKLKARYMGKSAEINVFDSEDRMMEAYITYYNKCKPDVVIAWNVDFDRTYLRNRAKALNINFTDNIADYFDLLEADRMYVSRRSHTLKSVTVEEGIEKYEEAIGAEDVLPRWLNEPWAVVKYNLRDVWRMLMIDGKYGYVSTQLAYKDLIGVVHVQDTLYKKVIVDTQCLRVAKRRGVVLPTSRPRQARRYKGAVVLEPPRGIVEGVAVLDMSKYYPSLIISFNVSPETKLRVVDRGNNIWVFRQDQIGLIPEAVKEVVVLEDEMRRQQSALSADDPMYAVLEKKIMAAKGVRNSFYGVMGSGKFRLYDPDCAATITGLAREGIMYVVSEAKKMGYRVVYGDTDSIFIVVPFEEADSVAEDLSKKVRRYFAERYGLPREPEISLKFEKYYRRLFFAGVRKRYAGWLVWKKGKEVDKIDVVGFEAVRSDVPPFTSYAQRRVFELILRQGYDPAKMDILIKSLIEEFKSKPLREIALYKGLEKGIDEYATDVPHVRAARYSNMYLGTHYTAKSKVRYVYVSKVRQGLPETDVVAFEDDSQLEGFEIDYDKMIQQVLLSPLERIFNAIGYRYGVSHKKWW